MDHGHENVVDSQREEIARLELEVLRLKQELAAASRTAPDAHGFLTAVYRNEALPLHTRLGGARGYQVRETRVGSGRGSSHGQWLR